MEHEHRKWWFGQEKPSNVAIAGVLPSNVNLTYPSCPQSIDTFQKIKIHPSPSISLNQPTQVIKLENSKSPSSSGRTPPSKHPHGTAGPRPRPPAVTTCRWLPTGAPRRPVRGGGGGWWCKGSLSHQTFQVPKMEVLHLYKLYVRLM